MFSIYFLEIKNRVLLILLAWSLTMFICYLYKSVLLFLLIKINSKLYNLELFYFISTNVSDVFSVCLKIAYFISYHCLIILTIYHFLMFLSSGLFKSEYFIFKLLIFNSLFLFFLSIFFFHLCILPILWDFFLIFQEKCGVNVFFESKITEYVSFYTETYILVTLISQFFAIIVFRLLIVKDKIFFIINSRKLIYISFIVISTIITPPDVVSQLCVIFCLSFFYESVVLILLIRKHLVYNSQFNYNYLNIVFVILCFSSVTS